MANLYTKTGDKGQTSLVGGSRVSKSSLRVECYGTIDEANSMLGLAYAQTDREYIRTTVHRIQGRLFALGAELASDEQGAAGLTGKISEEDVAFLEGVVDKCTETTGKQTHFVIPGVDPASAALHVARTIVRRAERHVAGKAYTANAFQMPTHELGQAARPDGPLYGIDASAPGKIVLFGGGFPYVVNGEVVGGIGVSGGTVEQDMDIARYAMSL